MSTQYSLLGWLSANAVGGSTSVTPIGTTNNAWNDLEVLPTGANGAIYWIGWDLDEFEDTLLLPCGLRPKGSSLGTSSYRFDPEHVVDPQEVGILLPCAAGALIAIRLTPLIFSKTSIFRHCEEGRKT